MATVTFGDPAVVIQLNLYEVSSMQGGGDMVAPWAGLGTAFLLWAKASSSGTN